jgi:hypothetical protein
MELSSSLERGFFNRFGQTCHHTNIKSATCIVMPLDVVEMKYCRKTRRSGYVRHLYLWNCMTLAGVHIWVQEEYRDFITDLAITLDTLLKHQTQCHLL